MILILDNFDSFTFNLVDYFAQLGVEAKVWRNNVPISTIQESDYSAVVLSPGPETPAKAGCLMKVLEHYHNILPILGICLGHQAIGEYFGASLIKAEKPMHGKVSQVHVEDDYLFEGLPRAVEVTRYHSLVLQNLPETLSKTAYSDKGEIMALKHNELPIRGLQFHPEAALTSTGLKMLENWIIFNNIV